LFHNFSQKRKKKKRKCKRPITARKSEMQCSVEAVKVFGKNTLARRERGRFFSKPAGLDLYCLIFLLLSL
jgi:hypothetical protein